MKLRRIALRLVAEQRIFPININLVILKQGAANVAILTNMWCLQVMNEISAAAFPDEQEQPAKWVSDPESAELQRAFGLLVQQFERLLNEVEHLSMFGLIWDDNPPIFKGTALRLLGWIEFLLCLLYYSSIILKSYMNFSNSFSSIINGGSILKRDFRLQTM